jgi:radical SAM protein with 4Fe4S-binding SPASM domain
MTAELAHALGELAVHVVEISLYSHRAEAHDAITGVAGSFERTVAGIRHLVREGVDVHVKTPIMSINEDELPEYTAFANSLGASFGLDPTALLPREARDREPERLTRSMEAVARVLSDPQLGGTPVEAESAESSPERDLSSSICGAGHYVLVEPNGVIRPCTMLHVDLGHAQEGIGNAREGNTVLDGLRGLTWADVHGCRECDLRGDCQRCHAASLAEVGDALAPYATACDAARAIYAARTGVWPRILGREDGDDRVGPFRRVKNEPHAFVCVDDVRTEADDALAARLPWVRPASGALPKPGPRVASGQLVQLRRPGRKRPSAMTFPKASQSS